MAATKNSWKIASGKWKTMWFKRTASTDIASGVLLELVAGYLVEATTTAGATDTPVAGIYEGPAITSALSTYATAEYIPVQVPVDPNASALGIVDTGTLAQTSVGLSYDISATNGVTQSTSTNEAVTCIKFITAALGEFVLTGLSSPAA
jgi:hypothetical protein